MEKTKNLKEEGFKDKDRWLFRGKVWPFGRAGGWVAMKQAQDRGGQGASSQKWKC